MKKKAGVMGWIIIFGVIAVIGLYFSISYSSLYLKEGYNGQQQLEMIKTYIEAEKVLFYIDQSAKYSLEKAQIGFETDNTKTLTYYLDINLKPYLKNAPHGKDELSTEYDYLITKNNIIGLAKNKARFISLPGRIQYYVEPHFNIKLN